MGEYAKYGDKRIKIGTCEDMYYLRYDQRQQVTPQSGNVDPVKDAAELRFRFPWPDEDHIEPGAFDDYNRSIPIDGMDAAKDVDHDNVQFSAPAGYLVSLPCPESRSARTDLTIHRNGFGGAVRLVAQRFRPGIGVVPVLRCGGCGSMWRLEDRHEIEELAVRLRSEGDRRRTLNGESTATFYHTIADRILAGIASEVAA